MTLQGGTFCSYTRRQDFSLITNYVSSWL